MAASSPVPMMTQLPSNCVCLLSLNRILFGDVMDIKRDSQLTISRRPDGFTRQSVGDTASDIIAQLAYFDHATATFRKH